MGGHSHAKAETGLVEPVQWFRAIAVLLVIALHSIELVKFRHEQLGEPLGVLSAPRFYDHFGASGVDLFFVISGFVMAHLLERVPQGQWTPFVAARLRRILPLYWLATLAMAVLLLALGLPVDPLSTVVSITVWPLPFRQTLDAPVLVVGWSLAFELAFYAALIPAIYAAARMRTLIALLFVGLFALSGQIFNPADNFAALFFNPMWYEFAFGLLLHLWWRSGIERGTARAAGMLGALLLAAGILTWVIPETRPFAIYDDGAGLPRALFWALPWAGVLAWGLSVKGRGWLSRVMLRIGDASYALYLTHMLVMTSLLQLLPRSSVGPDVLPVLAIGLALALGIATHDHVERPLLAYLKRKRTLAPVVKATV
jgi:exopolysaccharide production protein ExoZ